MARKLILRNINKINIEMEINKLHNNPIYPIRTAAKILNISVHTLRMYEREGLIIPHKTEGNQRAYSMTDIERVECIRKAINENKISINGIKTIYSLIPCWEIIGCSAFDRSNCQAFADHSKPCWTYSHSNRICSSINCRDCEVYKDYSNCGSVKDLLKKLTGNK